MRALQKELSDVRALSEREARQAEGDREELKIFRDRCMKLEDELEMRQAEVSDAVNPFCQRCNLILRLILLLSTNSELTWRAC